MNILLFGISNVGKTTTGRLLADRLGYKFYDMDEEVKSCLHITLEEFVNTVWPYERDKIRGGILENLVPRPENKVIAVAPMYYYLREIKKDITYYKKAFSEITNKLNIDDDSPEKMVERLMQQFNL